MARLAVAVATSALGVLAGVYSLGVARSEPAYWFAGDSRSGDAALLAAGWALIAAGVVYWLRRPRNPCGPLLAAAGFAWFVPEWNNAAIGSALAFTIGLVLSAAYPVLVGHALLAYPGGALSSRTERALVTIAYAGAVVVSGLAPALVFSPADEACGQCPRNLMLAWGRPGAADDLGRLGVYLGVAWVTALMLLVLARLARPDARRSAGPVLLPGGAFLGLVAAELAASVDRGFVAAGTLERRLWLGQAAALCAVAAGVLWGLTRSRRARAATARLVVDLAQSRPAGGLRASLGRIVGDPELVLAYPLDGSDRLVDADGRPVAPAEDLERTTLVRDGRTVAVLAHAPGALADEQLVEEVAAAARLALENERLQAEVRARVEELQASRARIVEAGDAERKRLERNLHDGAQQRLVGLSLSLRLLRSQLADSDASVPLGRAEEEVRSAVADLRELAHGIFPAVLADEGLAAAIDALAEDAAIPIRIDGMSDDRFPGPVETAAYTVVAELARTATDAVAVSAVRSGDVLLLEVETRDPASAFDVVGLEDRVGAIGGRLSVEADIGGRVTIRAELPCGS
jgi:signal transduction histidine kinase